MLTISRANAKPTPAAGRGHGDTALDAAGVFVKVPDMNFGSLYFRHSFAGWFYFSPSSWRVRLR